MNIAYRMGIHGGLLIFSCHPARRSGGIAAMEHCKGITAYTTFAVMDSLDVMFAAVNGVCAVRIRLSRERMGT